MSKEITSRSEDYNQWYIDIVKKAGLAEHSAVRGCMVIKPNGFCIWEKMQSQLDQMFKDTGHTNAYFPLFIPKSFFSREATHVDGFAKECAVVTHYRLKNAEDGSGIVVDPEAKLEEELIVRPTSETIIWNTYKDWVTSYRDLPLLINQWANVVRWEMRTRLFLRTSEFLWQEGHTAHSTEQEAIEESIRMQEVYASFAEDFMAMPVVRGRKTESERFAGALETYTIEALMQDGKALQAGTSHFLGQNFAKAFDVKFMTPENKEEYVWATSWGVSTRLIGGLIMTHSDDQGLIVPPKLAPLQVVIVPIPKSSPEIHEAVDKISSELKNMGISVRFDHDETKRPGFKFAQYEMEGVPVRIGVGMRDLEKGQVEVARRDTGEKQAVPLDQVAGHIQKLLNTMQTSLYEKALKYRDEHITEVNTFAELETVLEEKGGFAYAHWDGSAETEEEIKKRTKGTIRCIPQNMPSDKGVDLLSGKPSDQRVLIAKAY